MMDVFRDDEYTTNTCTSDCIARLLRLARSFLCLRRQRVQKFVARNVGKVENKVTTMNIARDGLRINTCISKNFNVPRAILVHTSTFNKYYVVLPFKITLKDELRVELFNICVMRTKETALHIYALHVWYVYTYTILYELGEYALVENIAKSTWTAFIPPTTYT